MHRPLSGGRALARRQISPFHLALLASAVALAALPAPARAQVSLTESEVTLLAGASVTASRSAKALKDVPRSVTVVEGEVLDKKMVRDIQDLVRYEPGVDVSRQNSATTPWGTLDGFTVRGVSGNRVQMQVDGSRIMESVIDGSRDVVDPWNMKAVEIVKGPSSVLWGADALGGVVAFRTLDPEDLLSETDNPFRFEVKTAYDSYDRSFRRQFNAAFEAGDFQFLGSLGNMDAHEPILSNARADGGIWGCTRQPTFSCDRFNPTDINAINGLAKVVWTPGTDHRITVTGEFFSRLTSVDQVDFAANAVESNPVGTQYINDYIRNVMVDRTRLAIEHEWDVGAEWVDSVTWKLGYSPQRRGTDSHRVQTYANRTVTQDALRDYSENFLEASLQLVSSFDTGGISHKLTYGADGDIARAAYSDRTTTVTDYFDPGTTDTTSNATYSGFAFPDSETRRGGLYIQDEIGLFDGRLTLTPGLRLAYYSIDPTSGAAPTPLPGFAPAVMENLGLVKSLSAKYDVTDEVSVYASYDEGFKMPTAQQLFVSNINVFTGAEVVPNPNLRPESVRSYEIGVKGEFDRGFVRASAFHSDYVDFIRSLQEIAPNKFSSSNVSSVKLWGVELSGEYELVDDFFLHGTATYQYGRQVLLPGAAEEFYEPATPLTAVVGLRYELPDNGLEFDLVATLAAGPTDRNDPNAFKPDGYALLDAYVRWEPSENVELSLGVQNIFDTRYFPNTMSGYNLPGFSGGANTSNAPPELLVGPGRTIKLGANIKY
jgi:hemoglobin/transferrin/lactoferrin receptor protein